MSPNMDVTLQLQIASESHFASFTLTFLPRVYELCVICEPYTLRSLFPQREVCVCQ